MREHQAAGLEHLALVTDLLQAARLANPTGGAWEAADFQWWWRRDQHPDPSASTFWLDDDDRPAAAVVFTDWGDRLSCELLDARNDSSRAVAVVGARLEELVDERVGSLIETTIRSDDAATLAAFGALGFAASDEAEFVNAMPAADRAPIT